MLAERRDGSRVSYARSLDFQRSPNCLSGSIGQLAVSDIELMDQERPVVVFSWQYASRAHLEALGLVDRASTSLEWRGRALMVQSLPCRSCDDSRLRSGARGERDLRRLELARLTATRRYSSPTPLPSSAAPTASSSR